MINDSELTRTDRLVHPRQLLYLAILALAVLVLVPRFVGFGRTISLLTHAQNTCLFLALGFELARYVLSALSTYVLAPALGAPVPYFSLLETFFAGGAANRVVSTGGAPGMVIRGAFLTRQGAPLGAVAVLFLIEDFAGFVVGTVISVIGVAALMPIQRTGAFLSAATGLLTIFLLILGIAFLYRRREWFQQGLHTLVRFSSSVAGRFLNRPFYDPARVQSTVDDFYSGLDAVWRRPLVSLAVLWLNLLRYAAGAAGLYFSFYALGSAIPPAALVILFTSVSMVSTISAAPGEAAIMGTSFAILALLGVPRDVGMVSMFVSRTITFWLPIPLGVLAFWDLQRRHCL